MDEEIQQAEENFKIIADSAPFALWISGLDKKCFYFNKCWLDFTGKTMEEEIGNGWALGIHPDDVENVMNIYVSYFNARKPFKMEYRLRRYDGLYRWLLDSGYPREINGRFMGFVGSCIDITDLWFAHHEMVSYSRQQEELVSCSNKLMNFLYDIKNYNRQQQQQLESNQNIIDSNYNTMMNTKINFVELILKSSLVSLNSNSAVLFKINPNNKLEMFVDAVVNNENGIIPSDPDGIRGLPRFKLPADFWDSYNGSTNNSTNNTGSGNSDENDASGSMPFFSILFQKYFTPYLNAYGIKSITATDVCSFNEKIYGFIVIGSNIDREYSSIEQNTLIGLANILGVYLNKTEESKIHAIKEKISTCISKNSDNPILTVDRSGIIIDMNPAAVKTLISSGSSKASQSQLTQLKVVSLFPFLKENGTSNATPFYTSLQVNYFSNSNRHQKNEDKFFSTVIHQSHQQSMAISVELLIKEIHFDESHDQSIYLFILKDLSLQKELEKSKAKELEKKDAIDSIYNQIKNQPNLFSKQQLELLNNLFILNNNDTTNTATQEEQVPVDQTETINNLFSKILIENDKDKSNIKLNTTIVGTGKLENNESLLNNILNWVVKVVSNQDYILDINILENNKSIQIKLNDQKGESIQFKSEDINHSLIKDYSPILNDNNSVLSLTNTTTTTI